jgi:hypothetical protein
MAASLSQSRTSPKYHMWDPPLVDWTGKRGFQQTPQIHGSHHFVTPTFGEFVAIKRLFSQSRTSLDLPRRRSNDQGESRIPLDLWLMLLHN